MYWQVYQHKTVLSAEMTLVKILERAIWLFKKGDDAVVSSSGLGNILFDKKVNLTTTSWKCFVR